MEGSKRKKILIYNDSSGHKAGAEVVLYFSPGRIQKKRLEIMINCAKRNGYSVATCFSDAVTYIVSEFEEEEQVIRLLKMNVEEWSSKARPEIVNTKWFADCIKQTKLVHIETRHKLKPFKEQLDCVIKQKECHQLYACQRANPLVHHNHKFTDVLEILSEAAELKDDLRNAARALAFQKAAALLKSLPYEITNAVQVQNLKDIGRHCVKVIKEVLEKNSCEEALEISTSEWFLTVKLFNSIYGIGPATANKWYNLGMRTLQDVKLDSSINWKKNKQNKRIAYGLALHEDLCTPVLKREADKIFNIIEKEAQLILPDVILHLTGGFRRGKTEGHDVDILLSHPVEDKEVGLLTALLGRLQEMGHVLYGGIERSHTRDKSPMDNFEKCFLIYIDYFDTSVNERIKVLSENPDLLFETVKKPRDWIARRVDLVVCRFSELAFALVGWIGNKHFNRSLREYAKKEKNMHLTSHALYDFTQNMYLSASTEEELFHHLGLPYQDPYYRNA